MSFSKTLSTPHGNEASCCRLRLVSSSIDSKLRILTGNAIWSSSISQLKRFIRFLKAWEFTFPGISTTINSPFSFSNNFITTFPPVLLTSFAICCFFPLSPREPLIIKRWFGYSHSSFWITFLLRKCDLFEIFWMECFYYNEIKILGSNKYIELNL